ncbi:MAG: hypothetical protein AAFP99_00180 [Pseudomonadota bacterium]
MVVFAAIIGALACLAPIAMQIGLALGAPWGEYANGGKFPGRLPAPMRFAAVVQGAILVFIALAVLDRGGILALGWSNAAFWVAMGITAITFVLNWITPSVKERRLWGPMMTVLLIAMVIVMLMSGNASANDQRATPASSGFLGDYTCPDAADFDVFTEDGWIRGVALLKLSSFAVALYPFAPPDDVLGIETSDISGAGYRKGDFYFFESAEGRHYLLHTPTDTRVSCFPDPTSRRAIQKRPSD